MAIVLDNSYMQIQEEKENLNHSEVCIRHAKQEDVEALGYLWLIHREYHYQFDEIYVAEKDAREKWTRQISEFIQQKNHHILVAEVNGEVVGYVHGCFYPWPLSPIENYGSLNTISVAEAYRGKGIGRILIAQLMDWFRTENVEHISIHVDVRNQAALSLYKSVGFDFYQHRMMLNLSNDC
jgi:ribosomal protein S18 acetylase RimI-like enzyme